MEPKTTINCCQHISVHAMSECAFSWLTEGEERTRKRGPQKILDGLIDGTLSPICSCVLHPKLGHLNPPITWKRDTGHMENSQALRSSHSGQVQKVPHSHKNEKPKILDSNYFTL